MAGQKPIGTDDGLNAPARPPEIDPAIAVAARFPAAEKAYQKALERRQHEETLGHDASDATCAAGDAAMHAADVARSALFRAEPTSVRGVATLLEALAHNDDSESPIEMYINADAGKTVNEFLRQRAKVLREAS
jgi:hypothetical protein